MRPGSNSCGETGMSDDAIDRRVSGRLVEVRRTRAMSRNALAEAVGVSPYQLEKYETGEHKISAGMLVLLAQGLRIDPAYLLSGSVAYAEGLSDSADFGSIRDALDGIRNETVRSRLVDLIAALQRSGV